MLEDESFLTPNNSSLKAVYVISVAAELAGMHPQTLRIYERKGLVDPSRTGGGSRRYTDDDVRKLRRIQELTSAGLNLEGVKRIMELEAELEEVKAELDETRRLLEARIDEMTRRYKREIVPFAQNMGVFEGYLG